MKRSVVQEEMLFKYISYLELWQPLCSVDWNHLYNFGRRHHEEQFVKLFRIWTNGSGEKPFKGISYLELWQPFCSAECYHLCKCRRGYNEKQFCENILSLGSGEDVV